MKKNSDNYKKTKKNNSMTSGIKLMNRNHSLSKRLKLLKKKRERAKKILEQKNSMNEMKNAKEFICTKVDQMERTISDLEDRNKEIIQLKKRGN